MGIGNSCDNFYQNKWQWKTLTQCSQSNNTVDKKYLCVCVCVCVKWKRAREKQMDSLTNSARLHGYKRMYCIPSNTRTERNRKAKASCNMKIPSFFVVLSTWKTSKLCSQAVCWFFLSVLFLLNDFLFFHILCQVSTN